MDAPSLKDTNPQKHYFKSICKFMYYIGMGDCWYETYDEPKSKAYRVWQFISNMYVFIVLFNELLAHCRSDLNEKEKTDLVQFSIAHPLVFLKIVTLYYKKNKFAVVMKRLLEGTRSTFHSIELERASVKQSTRYFLMLIISVYMTLISTFIDGTRAHIKDGIPIRTEVVLYPTPADTGIFVNILRSLIELHWYHMMSMMLSIDGFMICSLVIVRFKFKALKLYCQEMRTKVLKNVEKSKSRMDLEKIFKNDFVTAIKMHEDALWCARNVQNSMGAIYSIQVLESVTLLVMCLVKLVDAERNLFYLLATLAYVACLLVITGSYMMAGGDITHEAEMVPTSLYSCGWELIRARSDIRVLAVVALQRSQVPVHMTAFGMMKLSYANFISLVRSSYSFFAVMY